MRDLPGNDASGSPGASRVEVTQDLKMLEVARAAWLERQEEMLANALAQSYPISRYDRETIELLRRNRERSIGRLTPVWNNPLESPSRRLHAALALRYLDAAVPEETLVKVAEASDHARLELILDVSHGTPLDEPLSEPIEAFVVRAISDADGRVSDSALQLVAVRGLTSAGDVILEQIGSTEAPSANLLRAAARVRPTAQMLELIQQHLKPLDPTPLGDDSGFGALSLIAKHAVDPEIRTRAIDLCVDYLTMQPDVRWMAAFTSDAIETIAAVEPPDRARRLLVRIVSDAHWQLARDDALRHIANVDPETAAHLAKTYGLSLEARPQVTPTPVDGGIAEVARRCVSLGLLTQTEADNALAAITEGGVPAEGAHPVYSLLMHAKRLVFFDVEDGNVPVRHDRLLGWFADASACRFRPECAREDYVPASDLEGNGTYLVEFIHVGRLYRFHPRAMGDWYDVDSVVAAINQAIADTGVQERFLALADRGQWAGFVFGHPDTLRRAGSDIGLSLSAGSD